LEAGIGLLHVTAVVFGAFIARVLEFADVVVVEVEVGASEACDTERDMAGQT
jgi:hypothetical protein